MTRSMASKVVEGGADAGRPRGEPCPGCRQPMPVRAKRPEEVTIHWECTACRSSLTGVLLKEAVPILAAHVHLSQKHFEMAGVPSIPQSLRQLVHEFLTRRQHQSGPVDERRKSSRVSHQLDVIVVPLDDEWRPFGKPIPGIVVDLSAHGLGMITTAPLGATFVVAQIQHGGGIVQLLGKVRWSKEVGHGFHNAGVQFVVRFGRGKGTGTPGTPTINRA